MFPLIDWKKTQQEANFVDFVLNYLAPRGFLICALKFAGISPANDISVYQKKI
jgi:hypothetical protein